MTREEHLKWCKERAIQEYNYYYEKGKLQEAVKNGVTSMMSDIGKHPETQSPSLQSLCMMTLMTRPNMSKQEFINFINGFN
jgi:hypothetical protein